MSGHVASIVIATYARGESLLDALASVLEHSSRHNFEVVVVDQTPWYPAPVADALARALDHPRARYVSASPPSLPGARNLGISMARADIVVFVDDDVELDEGFLDGHVARHHAARAAGERVVGVGGRTRALDDRPTDALFTLDRFGRNSGEFDWPEPGEMVTLRGCNMSFDRAALLAIGGFDSRFTGNAYREESDLCFRLRKAGGRLVYEPAASLLHLEGPQGGCREASAIHDRPLVYQNETLFFLKNWPVWWLPVLLGVNLFSYVVTRYTRREGLIPVRLRAWLVGVPRGVRMRYRGVRVEVLPVGDVPPGPPVN